MGCINNTTAQRGQAIIAAIEAGLAAGADNTDWDAPEMATARELTDAADLADRCVWDFAGWKDAADCIRVHGKLGRVSFTETLGLAEAFAAVPAYTEDQIREYIESHDDDDTHDREVLAGMFGAVMGREPNEDEAGSLWSHVCNLVSHS